jgi:hypothetical protein
MISDKAAKRIILSLMTSRGDIGFTEEEAQIAIEEADKALVAYTLWKLVLKGAIGIDVKENKEVAFFPILSQYQR